MLGSLLGIVLLAGLVLYLSECGLVASASRRLRRSLLAAGLLDTLPVEAVSHEVNVTAPEKAATADGVYVNIRIIGLEYQCRLPEQRGFH